MDKHISVACFLPRWLWCCWTRATGSTSSTPSAPTSLPPPSRDPWARWTLPAAARSSARSPSSTPRTLTSATTPSSSRRSWTSPASRRLGRVVQFGNQAALWPLRLHFGSVVVPFRAPSRHLTVPCSSRETDMLATACGCSPGGAGIVIPGGLFARTTAIAVHFGCKTFFCVRHRGATPMRV